MISRRRLLRGSLSANRNESYPPWAIPPAQFVERCTRCDACLENCPERIIRRNEQGFPVVDFSAGGCTFCARCVEACENDSLSALAFVGREPWVLKATITDLCANYSGVVCRVCAEACTSFAIGFEVTGGAVISPAIDLDNCTGCGQCYRSCPGRAIRIEPSG